MKRNILTFALCLFALIILGQTTYKGFPLIKAKSLKADFRIGNDWVKGWWTISPQISSDSLFITCFSSKEDFVFYTDQDSIHIDLKSQQVFNFYISVNDTTFALTVIKGIQPINAALSFDTKAKNKTLRFWYEQNKNNDYLNLLRSKYPIDSLTKGTKSDTEKALAILHWVHRQWNHDGGNEPKKNDAISILEEAKEGKNFRCVEYGIVTTACLNSIGLKSRTLGLKTKNVETTESGAGHVLSEVYLNDLKKWVLLDGQWDVMPMLNNVPLNAVEFQRAITENYANLEIKTSSNVSKRAYVEWIYPYLYYFSFPFDNREGNKLERKTFDGKSGLMLVPQGAKNPTVFQRISKLDYLIYTNSLKDFYASPFDFNE
ncbi:MAG: transglutaminase-like domain-containing protein [Paludibacter sp.]|nr:transglutaminase-like domain-containing protein [Paludibacter sp.]